MTRELHKESMDIDSPGGSKGSPSVVEENGWNLYPVSFNDSGEGLPYAPEDWPKPGDKWGWKVGRRVGVSGLFLDRYLYVPTRLSLSEGKRKIAFASKPAVKQYIQEKFPGSDTDAFFASFIWKIPSKLSKKGKDDKDKVRGPVETAEGLVSVIQTDEPHCKAGNRFCSSLAATEDSISEVMFCDICCSEPCFCRDCCCILCSRIIDKTCDGYNYVRCEALIEGCACGHSCHITCALRAYMAGTVEGSIGLDAEYYCRRCDSRTDLVSHVQKLLDNSESVESRDDIEKILKVSISVLHGSKKTSAKQLLHHIESAMSKLRNGSCINDIWKKEDDGTGLLSNANGTLQFPTSEDTHDSEMDSPLPLSSKFDHRAESLKLEDQMDRVLDALRKSQEVEYRLAVEKLSSQKNYILNLYKQLEEERKVLRRASSKNQDLMLDIVMDRVDSVKREVSRLKDMAKVAKGFGRVPKHILKEQFGLDVEH